MSFNALVHLRVPAATKGRWVRASRAAGVRLTDWVVNAVELYMQQQMARVVIPDDLEFSDLRLSRDPDGSVTFDWSVIQRICEASGLPVEMLQDAPEDNVSGLIVGWYQAHRQHGGESDPVADDLIAEVLAEEKAGQAVSYKSGRA